MLFGVEGQAGTLSEADDGSVSGQAPNVVEVVGMLDVSANHAPHLGAVKPDRGGVSHAS